MVRRGLSTISAGRLTKVLQHPLLLLRDETLCHEDFSLRGGAPSSRRRIPGSGAYITPACEAVQTPEIYPTSDLTWTGQEAGRLHGVGNLILVPLVAVKFCCGHLKTETRGTRPESQPAQQVNSRRPVKWVVFSLNGRTHRRGSLTNIYTPGPVAFTFPPIISTLVNKQCNFKSLPPLCQLRNQLPFWCLTQCGLWRHAFGGRR